MKNNGFGLVSMSVMLLFLLSCELHADPFSPRESPLIIDHTCTQIGQIPSAYLDAARKNLKVVYGHTSHGSQLVSGMKNLDAFMQRKGYSAGTFGFNHDGSSGAMMLHDAPFNNAHDLGNPNFTAWAGETRQYLNQHPEINVVMWSWCGQVSWASESDMNSYLTLMNDLEADFPDIVFVYMTGHLDGGGEEGDLNKNNNRIRNFCREHNKALYDFADIESYDPDGTTNYMKLYANDNCDYQTENGQEKNWATDWQNSHTQNADWFNCDAAHSQPLNGNLKAWAAWWMFARLAGWNPGEEPVSLNRVANETQISWKIVENAFVAEGIQGKAALRFFNSTGKLLFQEFFPNYPGDIQPVYVPLSELNSHFTRGLVFFQLTSGLNSTSGKFSIHPSF